MRRPGSWFVSLVMVIGCQRADERPAPAPAPAADPAAAARRDAGAAAAAVAVTPSAVPGGAAPASACPSLVVALRPGGVWIGDDKSRSVAAPCAGDIDRAAVKERLCALAGSVPAGCDAIQVAADPGVPYRQVVDLMDLAMSVGFTKIAFTDPGSLAVPLREPADPRDKIAARCGAELPSCPARASGAGGGAAGAAGLADAVIAVRADGSVLVGGEVVASAAQASAGDRIEPLFQALRAKSLAGGWKERTAVLQGDRAVDARVIHRVIGTARAAGYTNVLFAVKKAPAAP